MIRTNVLNRTGVKSPAASPLRDSGISLSQMQGGVYDLSRGGLSGRSGSGARKTPSLSDYVDTLYRAYRPEKLAYTAVDGETLRDQIAAWLRPGYDSAIRERGQRTARYRAELDADALSRGMGSSTYVTDVKSRQLQDEADDVAALESEYGAQLGKLLMEAVDREKERELSVAMQNQENENEAYLLAYRTALGLYTDSLKRSGGGGAGSRTTGTTERNCRLFLEGLTPGERLAVYSGADETSARYREEIIASVGGRGYLDLVREYPFF